MAGLREQLFSLQNDARLERERLLEENGRLRQASLESQTRSDREMEAIAREAEDIHKAVEQELEEALERVKDLQGAKHAIEIVRVPSTPSLTNRSSRKRKQQSNICGTLLYRGHRLITLNLV